jgi:hypothetical protein
MPEWSSKVTRYKAYTGMSRHIADAHMVVSDAAERRQIVKRQMLGLNQTPSEADVVRNIAENLSRFPAKRGASCGAGVYGGHECGDVLHRWNPRRLLDPRMSSQLNFPDKLGGQL